MKKTVIILLSMTLMLSLFLAACSNSDSTKDINVSPSSGDAGSSEESNLTAPGTFPIVNEKVTLNIMVGAIATVENYETNEFTKWLEDKTNVHINWEIVPANSIPERLNLMFASGDYPDVLLNMRVSPQQQSIYGSQGVLVPLNNLIEKYGVNTQQVFNQLPNVKELITSTDGNIYALPQIEQCYHCSFVQRMWIYKPWLDTLNLSVPTTTDEFYKVLKAFKENDPNGNGIADEVPLSGALTGWNSNIDGFLMNSFIYNGKINNPNRMYLEKGKVVVPYNKPEWKEGLKYLHKLYAEGLLAPESFTQDRDQLTRLGENPDAPILGAVASGGSHAPRLKDFNTPLVQVQYEDEEPFYAKEIEYNLQHYVDYVTSQVTELLTNYGPVAGIWLDGVRVPLTGDYNKFKLQELYNLIHRLSPHAIVSYKRGVTGTEDFRAPEFKQLSQLDPNPSDKPLEICDSFLKEWGYVRNGTRNNADYIISGLAAANLLNANLLFNIAPMPDGSVHPDEEQALRFVEDALRSRFF